MDTYLYILFLKLGLFFLYKQSCCNDWYVKKKINVETLNGNIAVAARSPIECILKCKVKSMDAVFATQYRKCNCIPINIDSSQEGIDAVSRDVVLYTKVQDQYEGRSILRTNQNFFLRSQYLGQNFKL